MLVMSRMVDADPFVPDHLTDALSMHLDLTAKLAWVREGAGLRYPDIELSLIPSLVLERDRERAATELIIARGWTGVTPADVLAMPSVFIGSLDEIAEQMEERRARYGFSYYVVSDRQLDRAAPLVARLAAR